MSTHPIQARDPRFEAWEEEGKRLRDRRTSLAAQLAAAHAEATEARLAHEAAVDVAVERGQPIPPPPPPPDLSHLQRAEAIQQEAEQRHRADRREVLADMADDREVWKAIEDRFRALLHRLGQVSPTVREVTADVEATITLARSLWLAQDARRGTTVRPPRSETVRTRWSADDLMAAAVEDLLRPDGVTRVVAPPNGVVIAGPEPMSSAAEINASHVERLGLTTAGASGFGTPRWPEGRRGSPRDWL